MFDPKYTLSAKLLNNITAIERLYGNLESLKMPKSLLLKLEKNNLIRSSFFSNSIEGNPLSLPEVTNLLLDARVPVNRDEKEVVNYFDILNELEKYKSNATNTTVLLKLHKQLLSGVKDSIAGKIREKPIVVGKYVENKDGTVGIKVKHNPPAHNKNKIQSLLDDLFEWTTKNADIPAPLIAGIFHHQFVFIHPFEDGNGRVCRLMAALLFLSRGYLINKYFVLDDYYDVDRPLYSDSLHKADKGNLTAWLEYFTDGIVYSLQSALSKAKHASKNLAIDIRPTAQESRALELIQEMHKITSTDLAKKLDVSRQQAHSILRNLSQKGFVEKKGGPTKSSYYVLKQ